VSPVIRPAAPDDLDLLVAIETTVFPGDRLSRRAMRHHVGHRRNVLVVVERDGVILGYALVALRSGSALARLYSIALVPEASGTGLGARLLDAAEQAAAERGATAMRLEVRADNASAIRLYDRRGYRRFGLLPSYYEDGQDALRFEKRLPPIASRADAATG
jgi:ribosomal protein S18 acetylase RimI-like enzyme